MVAYCRREASEAGVNCYFDDQEMRDRIERFVLLPFSVGCVSESSIAVAVQQQRQPRPRSSSKPAAAPNSSSAIPRKREEDEESISSDQSMKSSFRFLANSKPDISNSFHRLFKSVRNISQLFVYKEEMEEMEEEMEIGFPTDVKHVTHIGIDGSVSDNNNNNPMKGWENLMAPALLTTIPSVSLDQFELSMAAQAEGKPPASAALKKESKIPT